MFSQACLSMQTKSFRWSPLIRLKTSAKESDFQDLMDSFGKRTQRTNFGRSGSDLKCSMQVEERKNGSFNRNI